MLDQNGKQVVVTMGSYGIGVSRAVAAIAETTHDERGLCWPRAVAPADVHVVATGKDDSVFAAADAIVDELESRGVGVLYDDRRQGLARREVQGRRAASACRAIVVVGKGLADGVVEVRDRRTGSRRDVPRSAEAADPRAVAVWRSDARASDTVIPQRSSSTGAAR